MGRIDSSLVNKMESAVPAGKVQGSGWGTHVYLWQIHFDIWQIKIKKKKKELGHWEVVWAVSQTVLRGQDCSLFVVLTLG